MANATYTFKEEIKDLIESDKMKVWLTKRHGRRVEYIFKVGSEQFSPPIEVASAGDYLLFAQGVNEEVENELQDLFTEFI